MELVVKQVLRAALLVALSATSLAGAAPQNDFDSDGVSDIFTTSGASPLSWSAIGSTSGIDELSAQTFGLSTDIPVPAQWESVGVTALGVVRPKIGSSRLVWKVFNSDQLISQFEFGKVGDLVLAGGDFDGNGIADAAVVRLKKRKIIWRVMLNPLTDESPTVKTFELGALGDRVFFASPDGVTDLVGVFGPGKNKKGRLKLRNVLTGNTRTVNKFPRALTTGVRPRPIPIAGADGADLLAFVAADETDTSLKIYDIDANLVQNITIPGLGTAFVGEYNNAAVGEELCINTTDEIVVFNGTDGTITSKASVTDTPLDEIQVAEVVAVS